MAALTISSLNNGQADLVHIEDVATSKKRTAIDRLGQVKLTLQGAIDTIKAFNPRGSWDVLTEYSMKDVVSYGGGWYLAVISHISGENFEDDGGNWRVFQGEVLQPLGVGAVARTNQNKWLEYPSITDRGAVSGALAGNPIAFGNMEADEQYEAFYVPDGVFSTGLNKLKKRYFGPGTVLLGNGIGISGTPASSNISKSSGLSSINAGRTIGIRSDIWIGDSNYCGFGVEQHQSWLYLLQEMVNAQGLIGQGSYQTGGNFDRLSRSGTIHDGVSGPLRASLILTPGAKISFSSDFADYLAFWYERRPDAGSITLTKGAGILLGTVFCTGVAASNIFSGIDGLTISKGGRGELYTLECAGGNVEITGIFASSAQADGRSNPVFFQLQARSGYSSSDFVDDGVIEAIRAQTVYGGFFPRYFYGLGTNDIFNPSKAISAQQYQANVRHTVGRLAIANSSVVLVVPLRAGNSAYTPVIEPFDNYRRVIYELARELNFDVLDLSELDLVATGAYQPDGLHFNPYGHGVVAAFVYERYYAGMVVGPHSDAIELINGAGLAGSGYAPPRITLQPGGMSYMDGWFAVTGIPKGTYIGRVGIAFTAPTRQSARVTTVGSSGTATLLIEPNGFIQLFDYTADAITYLSLDGSLFSRV